MKSPLLAGKLSEVFGGDGEAVLVQLLSAAATQRPELVKGVGSFLDAAVWLPFFMVKPRGASPLIWSLRPR